MFEDEPDDVRAIRQGVVCAALLEYHSQQFMRVGNSLATLRDDKRVAMFWRAAGVHDKVKPALWDQAFCLHCFKSEGLALGVRWNPERSFIDACDLREVAMPRPGDVAFAKGRRHEIVENAVRGEVWSISGNPPAIDRRGPQGTLPARELSSYFAFYSIYPLIRKLIDQRGKP